MPSLRLLTELERAFLEANLRKARDASEWRRLFIILSYDEGRSIEELAIAMRLSKWTVEDYLKKYSSSHTITLSKAVAMLGMRSLQTKELSNNYVPEIGQKLKLIFDKWYN